MIARLWFCLLVILFAVSSSSAAEMEKIIISRDAEPGAHSLPFLLLAGLEQPDFLELPLVLTKDSIPLVYGDLFLHPQTNVAEIFPERSRPDGNYYVIDFTLAEITRLTLAGNEEQTLPTTHLASLDDALQILSLLGPRIEKKPEILPVIKFPWLHVNEGYDISDKILKTLIAHSPSPDALIHLKCFDPDELQRIKRELLPGLPLTVSLVQGIDTKGGHETMRRKREGWVSYNYDWMYTRLGLRVLSGYADAIFLENVNSYGDKVSLESLVANSHALNMKVFTAVPEVEVEEAEEPATLFNNLLFTLNFDGLALRNPKHLREFLEKRQAAKPEPPGLSIPDIQKDEKGPALFSDPERLGERLREIQ